LLKNKKDRAAIYCVTLIELQAHRDAFIQNNYFCTMEKPWDPNVSFTISGTRRWFPPFDFTKTDRRWPHILAKAHCRREDIKIKHNSCADYRIYCVYIIW